MPVHTAKGYVYEVLADRGEGWRENEYPFSLAAVRTWERLRLHENVTFLVGENGSGKSTLVEAIAIAWGFNPEGGTKNFNFGTRASHSPLHDHIRLVKTPRRAKDGFFLRAESFFNVATAIDDYGATSSYGGQSLHEMSHGQSFMALIENRFGGHGFYVLDEPEAALSPNRQLSFLSLLHQLVEKDSQFVIATHSPIILGYPHAKIFEITESGVLETAYEDLEHVTVTKSFLNRRETFLDVLLSDEEDDNA